MEAMKMLPSMNRRNFLHMGAALGADTDPIWGKGFLNGDTFTGLVYRTL
jgi:hypothetical protein